MNSVTASGSVKAGDVIGMSGNSGLWTTGPHVHWQAQQGTDVLNRNTINPLDVVGHANGGIFRNRHIAEINEEGPEAIIPLSARRRGRAKNLHSAVGNVIGNDKETQETNNLLREQNEHLMELVGVAYGIEDKTGFEPGKARNAINRFVDDRTMI